MEKIKEKLRELINSADESKHSKEELDNLSKFVENLEKFTCPTNIKK